MKFFAALALVLPAVSALTPTFTAKRDFKPLNPSIDSLHPKVAVAARAPTSAPETNAQRLARGLNPLSPRALRRHKSSKTVHAHHPRQSQTPPTSHAGILKVVGTDGNALGFVGTMMNKFGEYELTSDMAAAVPVSFSASADGGIISVSASTGSATYPFLGGIVGSGSVDSSFGPGDSDYAYIGGVSNTAEGPAMSTDNTFSDATGLDKPTESVMWTFDPSTSVLAPRWTNADGSEPTVSVVSTGGFFVVTGDVDAFTTDYGPAPAVSFVLVSA